MYTYLNDRQHYEDLYDRITVDFGRRNITYYDKFLEKFSEKDLSRPGNVGLVNMFYLQVLGYGLIRRYEEREEKIASWIAADKAKDEQVSLARLSKEPSCEHCSKEGLRIIDKSLMTREHSEQEEVLFMLKCPHCDKNSAYWENGARWERKPDLCPQCNAIMDHSTNRTKTAIMFTYSCPSCKHSSVEKMGLASKKERPDPDFSKDRVRYCLLDDDFRKHLYEIRRVFEGLAELGKQMKEREDNKHIYQAISEVKKPKIAELAALLAPTTGKIGYTEFTLDKPEIGKDVFVGFSCLDNQSERSDYDSRKTLEKAIKKALEDTNWRLMSDGVHYRLGYLTGRLRAYERDEDIRELVIKTRKLKEKQSSSKDKIKLGKENKTIRGKNNETIIL